MLPFNPFSALTSKIFAGFSLVSLLACLGLWIGLRHVSHERDQLQEWKTNVVTATRDAAHRPQLAEQNVAAQIRNLGLDVDNLVTAQEIAKRQALAAKEEQERRDRDNKRRSDDALPSQIADQRKRSAAWADTHRVQRSKSDPPEVGSRTRQTDLPEVAFGPGQSDGPDQGPALDVTVPLAYMDACDVVTARLQNAQDWWVKAQAGALTDKPVDGNQTTEVTP